MSRGSGFILQKGSSENPRLRVSLVLLRRVCYILRNNRSGQQNNGGKNRRCRIYGTYHHADSSSNGVAYGSPRSLLPLSPLPAAGRNSPFHPCRLRRRGLPERKNGRQKKNSCCMCCFCFQRNSGKYPITTVTHIKHGYPAEILKN